MATIYKVEIETVSAFVNYDEKHMEELFKKFLKEYKDPKTGHKFENTKVKVKRR